MMQIVALSSSWLYRQGAWTELCNPPEDTHNTFIYKPIILVIIFHTGNLLWHICTECKVVHAYLKKTLHQFILVRHIKDWFHINWIYFVIRWTVYKLLPYKQLKILNKYINKSIEIILDCTNRIAWIILWWLISVQTRLLGRPQPQMYPPVALNQYTLVNRTHKHYLYIYMPQGPANILKSHQSSTICKIWK